MSKCIGFFLYSSCPRRCISFYQLLIQHTSKQVIVIADSRKIGVRDRFSSSDIRSIDYLITDSNANPAQLSKIEAAGVKVQLVDPC